MSVVSVRTHILSSLTHSIAHQVASPDFPSQFLFSPLGSVVFLKADLTGTVFNHSPGSVGSCKE